MLLETCDHERRRLGPHIWGPSQSNRRQGRVCRGFGARRANAPWVPTPPSAAARPLLPGTCGPASVLPWECFEQRTDPSGPSQRQSAEGPPPCSRPAFTVVLMSALRIQGVRKPHCPDLWPRNARSSLRMHDHGSDQFEMRKIWMRTTWLLDALRPRCWWMVRATS